MICMITGMDVKTDKMNTNSLEILRNLYMFTWESINESTDKFQVMSNIPFYKKHGSFDDDFIDKFIYNIEKNIILVPLKIVNVNTNSENPHVIDHERVERRINSKLNENGIKFKINIVTNLQSIHFSFTQDFENDYHTKLPDCDYVILTFYNGDSDYFNDFKNDLMDHFASYKSLYATYKNVQESIIKGDPNYHKLINEKNKNNVILSRTEEKLKNINNEIARIETKILKDELVWDAQSDFSNEKEKCFYNIISPKTQLKSKVTYKNTVSDVINAINSMNPPVTGVTTNNTTYVINNAMTHSWTDYLHPVNEPVHPPIYEEPFEFEPDPENNQELPI